jgi:HEAT repeat protein
LAIVREKREGMRGLAADALGRIGKEAQVAVPVLKDCLKEMDSTTNDSFMRLLVAGALVRLGDAEAGLPPILEAVEQGGFWSFLFVGGTLMDLGPGGPAAVPSLVKALKHKSPRVRCLAAAALGQVGPAAGVAVPALEASWKGDGGDVAQAAGEALMRIDPEAARRAGVPETPKDG